MLFRKSKKTEETKKPVWRQWVDAGVFAIIAATLVRTFCFEAYAIPTGSMEGTLLINDHLYVSKMAYGARIPMTPLALPLMHNAIPFLGTDSYTEAVQWKYRRLPGFGHVKRDDIVVFNGPNGDTAIKEEPDLDYYQACRLFGRDAVHHKYTIVTRPVDKKENLIKRCIAIPGDVVEIKNAVVYVNGTAAKQYPHTKLTYLVRTNGRPPAVDDEVELLEKVSSNLYAYSIACDQLDKVRKAPNVVSADLYIKDQPGTSPAEPGEWVFPLDPAHFRWNRDNYGPLTIPKAGATVALTPHNIALYRRIIKNYEGNALEEKDGKIFINGKEASAYTFKMDYYWMMGDNRHNSLDSRYWGFVPDDHVVGKASFVWFSYGKDGPVTDIHWDRLLRGMHKLEN